MALHIGDIEANIRVDLGQSQSALDRFSKNVEQVETSLKSVDGSKVSVKPTGERELQSARKSADGLERSLSSSGQAAEAITLDRRLSASLSDAESAAKETSAAFGSAAGSAREMGAASGPIRNTASAMGEVASNAGRVGDARSGVEGTNSALVGLLGTAKQLIPALSVGALGGTILSKGWDRLTGIDDATFKLQGLGHEVKAIEGVMDSAMTSVRGTSYGFADAANAAAQAVAAGVEPGQQLTNSLEIMTDTAAIAGAPLNDIVSIFGQVRVNGNLMREELLQLSERGLPIFQMLSDSLGVTTEDLNDMVSDGVLGIEDLEKALGDNLGGAAKEMGGSVSGALSNVSAALGRLGANILSGPFSQVPAVLSSTTGAIDSTTDAVSGLYEAWGELPGPVKQATGLLLLAKASAVTAESSLGQKFTEKLHAAGGGFTKMGNAAKASASRVGESAKLSFKSAQSMALHHSTAAAAASRGAMETRDAFTMIDRTGAQMGHSLAAGFHATRSVASGAFGGIKQAGAEAFNGLKKGGKGVVDFFGGPWALGFAAAAAVAMKIVDAAASVRAAEKEVAVAARDARDAHDELTRSLERTNGVLTGESVSAAQDWSSKMITQFTATGEAYDKMNGAISGAWSEMGWVDALKGSLRISGDLGREYDEIIAKNRDHANAQSALNDVMGELGLTQEGLAEVVSAGGAEYERLASSLRAMGEDGYPALKMLEDMRYEIEQQADAAKLVDDSYVLIRDGIEAIADEASSADEKLAGLNDVLREMGLMPKESTDALFEMAEGVSEIVEKLGDLSDMDMGDMLKDPTAGWSVDNLNEKSEASQLLYGSLKELQSEYAQARLDGVEHADAWASVEPTLEQLGDKFGRTTEEVTALSEEMGLVPSVVDVAVELQGSNTAMQELGAVWAQLSALDEGESAKISLDNADAMDTLEELGYKLEEVDGAEGVFTVSADTDKAKDGLEEVLGMGSVLNEEEISPTIFLDTEPLKMGRADAEQLIRELGMETAQPGVDLLLDELFADGVVTRAELAALSSEKAVPVADLDDQLHKQKIQSAKDATRAMDKEKGTAKIDGDTGPLQRAINVAKSMLNLIPGVNIPIGGSSSPAGGSSSFARGGRVPALASGGLPGGGYRLPTSGPGTHKVDGFLGVDNAGIPTARVNRGEFVTNAASTEKYLPAYHALNTGDVKAAVGYLTNHLPGYADGGIVSAPELLGFAKGNSVRGQRASRSLEGAPYVFGGINWGDCSGAMAALARFAVGLDAFSARFATMNQRQALSALGARSGPGNGPRIEFGWLNGGPGGGHTSGTIVPKSGSPVNVEMGGGRGNGQIGGGAAPASHPQYTDRAHLPLMGGNSLGVDQYGNIMSTSVNGVVVGNKYKNETIDWGTAGSLLREMQDTQHKEKQLGRFKAGIYDTGGVLRPGGMAVNLSPAEEVIINGPQLQAINNLANNSGAVANQVSALVQKLDRQQMESAAGEFNNAARTGEWSSNKYIDKNSPLGRAAIDVYDAFGNAMTAAGEMKAGEILQIGERLGAGFITQYFEGVVNAHEGLEDSYVAQVDAADAERQAVKNLAEARKNLAEVEADTADVSEETRDRLIEAQKELSKAQDSGDSKKIESAEKKVASARKKVNKESKKAEKDRAKDIQDAVGQVTEAEGDLADARGLVKAAATATGHAEIAMAVEVAATIMEVAKAAFEWLDKTLAWFHQVDVGRAKVHQTVLANVAELSALMEEQQQLVASLHMQMVAARIETTQSAWDLRVAQAGVFEAQLKGILGVQTAEEKLQAERKKLNERAIYDFRDLSIEYDKYINSVLIGFELEGAGRAELQNLTSTQLMEAMAGQRALGRQAARQIADRLALEKGLSDTETALLTDVFAGKFAGYDLEAAALDKQAGFAAAYYAAQEAGLEGLLGQALQVNPEMLALQREVLAADLERQRTVKEASLEALDAAYRQQTATVELSRLTDDLRLAQGRLQRLDGGMPSDQATILAEMAKLQAQNAEYGALEKNLGNKLGGFLDFDSDGKVFGGLFGDNKGAQELAAARAGLEANQARMAELQARLDKLDGDTTEVELSREDRKRLEMAGLLFARGEDDKAQALIDSTALGDASNQLWLNNIDDQLEEIERKRIETQREIEDGQAERDYRAQALPLQAAIESLLRLAESESYASEALRSTDPGVRDAYMELSRWAKEVGTEFGATSFEQPLTSALESLNAAQQVAETNRATGGDNVTVIEMKMGRDDVLTFNSIEDAIGRANGRVDGVELRLTEVENRDKPTGRDIALQRAGRK